MAEKYLTAQQLAERWQYETPKPIYAMKEEIGYTRIGKKILFPIENIEDFERKNTITPQEAE